MQLLFCLIYFFGLLDSSQARDLKVIKEQYTGTWNLMNGSFFDYTETKGLLFISYSEYHSTSLSYLTLMNGFFIDDFSHQFLFQNSSSHGKSTIFHNCSHEFFGKNDLLCNISLELEASKKQLSGHIFSEDCEFHVNFSTDSEESNIYEKPRIIYSFMLFCVCFLQSFVVTRFKELTDTYESIAKKTSLLSLMMYASIDFSFVMFNIQELIREQKAIDSMMMGLIWSLISFYTIRSKLLFLIFKAQHQTITAASAQLIFSRYLVIYYFFQVVINVLAYQFKFVYLIYVPLMLSYFIPQVYFSAKENIACPYAPFMAILLCVSRVVLLYISVASAYNPLQYRPKTLYFAICTGYLMAQCLIVITQRFRPRLLVPRFLLPKPYEYLKDIEMTNFKECSICLGSDSLKKIMVAPCGHCFHESCMIKWLEIKLACPMCRKSLPHFEGK